MNKLLKDAAGIAAILVIIIVIVGVTAGGATVLAVRMIVTGESYLAPFEELGWISSDDERDSKDKKSDKEGKKEITTLEDTSRLSEESRDSKAVQYYGSITSAEMSDYSSSDDYYDLYNSIELEVNVFALDDKVVEIVFHIDLGKCLKVMYEEYGDEIEEMGETYDSYEDFEDDYLPYFESMMETMLISDDEMSEYIDIYTDNGVFEMYVTEAGFESLYDLYDIDPDSENISDFIDEIEDGLGIKLEEV